jgi:hypothetical protein
MRIADRDDRLFAGIAGSNPVWGMDVCLLCLYLVLFFVGRGLCDEVTPRPEESTQCLMRFRNPKTASENVDRFSNPKKIRIVRLKFLMHFENALQILKLVCYVCLAVSDGPTALNVVLRREDFVSVRTKTSVLVRLWKTRTMPLNGATRVQ